MGNMPSFWPQQDGLWTGNDWTDAANNVQVINGVLQGMDFETHRYIDAGMPITYPRFPGDGYMNVELVKELLTEEMFNDFFPDKLDIYQYNDLLGAIRKFPRFCGEPIKDTYNVRMACKLELATLLAHMEHESGSFRYMEEIACNGGNGGWNCNYTDTGNVIYGYNSEKQYYGRGPFQLSWNYNYGQFSTLLNDVNILLDDPDMIARDGELAFMSALWFYMYPQPPKPSMHDVTLGYFEPNQSDLTDLHCTKCFGSTINIINGGQECGHYYVDHRVQLRIDYYKKFCEAFGAVCDLDTDLSCERQRPFSVNGSANKLAWFEQNWTEPNKCKVVSYVTGYSIFAENDYKRCVCDKFDPANDECLVLNNSIY